MKSLSFKKEVPALRAFRRIDSIGVQGVIAFFCTVVYFVSFKGYFCAQ